MGLLVLFAGTFGFRWALLAAALVLLFVGFVLSGVKVSVRLPKTDGDLEPADSRAQ
jgi:hypothetical protein